MCQAFDCMLHGNRSSFTRLAHDCSRNARHCVCFDVWCFISVICSVCRPDNLYKAEDFSTFQTSGDVLLDVCTADSPAQLMLDRISNKVSVCLTCPHILSSMLVSK